MMMPRMALFRTLSGKTVATTHIVMVDGDSMKFLCIRHEAKRGNLVGEDTTLSCSHCMKRGWAKYHGKQLLYSTASIS